MLQPDADQQDDEAAEQDPAPAKQPATLQGPLLQKLEDAFKRYDDIANANQRSRLTFALFAAALGPIAVFLLSVQALVFPEGGVAAQLLIGGELLALSVALAMGFLELTKSHASWIRARLRAEILRREVFLLQVRVGPYLTKDALSEFDVDQRLLLIAADEREPEEFLAPGDEENGNWREALANQWRAGKSTSIPCQPACTDSYLETRVCDQRNWFNKKSNLHNSRARWWENGAKLILLLAVIVAALHLGMLLVPGHAADEIHHSLVITAICLPPLGAALVGLHSILGSHRLTRSYRYTAAMLNEIEGSLRRLKSSVEESSGLTDDQTFEFKRLVLQTEELLSEDLLRWWLIMKPEAPKAGP